MSERPQQVTVVIALLPERHRVAGIVTDSAWRLDLSGSTVACHRSAAGSVSTPERRRYAEKVANPGDQSVMLVGLSMRCCLRENASNCSVEHGSRRQRRRHRPATGAAGDPRTGGGPDRRSEMRSAGRRN